MKKSALEAARASLELESRAVLLMKDCVESEAFARAVDLIAHAPRVMTCASGTSGIAAKKLAHSLCCAEIGAMFMSPAEAVHGGLGALKEGDVMVMVSRGGKTAELLPIIDAVAKRKAYLVATSSYMATIAVFDALLVALMEETNYQKEWFGVIHPGGAVGKMLNG